MKKIAGILIFVFAFTLTTEAQKNKKHKRPELTTEQHVNLAVKKMTLTLDLSEKQQKQLRPLIAAKFAQRKASMEKRKLARKNKKKPTADEIYEMKNKMLDDQIMMKKRMKDILNKEQFEKFEKMQKGRKMMMLKKMKKKKSELKKRKGKKIRKMKKEEQ